MALGVAVVMGPWPRWSSTWRPSASRPRSTPTHVDVSATGTAGEFDSALSVTQKNYHVSALPGQGGLTAVPAQNVHGTAQAPLPYRLSNFVLAILGLTNYGPYNSQTLHVDKNAVKPQPSSSSACVALTGLANACNLPSDFVSNYDLKGLYAKGANGSGQTLAIVTLAPWTRARRSTSGRTSRTSRAPAAP